MSNKKYLLAIKGLIRGKKHWGDLQKKFNNYLPDYEIIMIDIAGNGTRFAEQSYTSIMENVEDLRIKLYQKVEKDAEIHVLALSLGGMIALNWIQKYPNDFKSLILANTSFSGLSPFYKRLRPSALFNFIKIAMKPKIIVRERAIYTLVSNTNKAEHLIELWAKLGEENPISRTNAVKQIYAASNCTPKVKEPIPIPAYVLTGALDRLCNTKCSDDIAKNWNLPIDRHETAGHELQNDAPEWFFEKIKKWVHDK